MQITKLIFTQVGPSTSLTVVDRQGTQIQIDQVLVKAQAFESHSGDPAISIEFPNIRNDQVSRALFDAFSELASDER